MGNQTIRVKTHSTSNGWFNITTEDGKQVSTLAEKNPKIKAILESNPDGNIDLPCNLVDKNGKLFAWDQKEQGQMQGFKKGSSGSDESFALSYAKDLGCAKLESAQGIASTVTAESIIKDAETFYNWLKSKKA